MKKKRALITGGEGFLGSYLKNYLESKGIAITIFDRLSSVPGDITNPRDIEKVFVASGPFDVVYHLASAMPDKVISDKNTWKTNVEGTSHLVQGAVRHKVNSFIFTSSNVVYGIPPHLPVTEATPPGPLEVYGRSKLQAESEIKKYRKSLNIQIFRCPVITGVGRLGLQAILFEFISENKNIYTLGDGSNTYQFVDAMDVSVALERSSHLKGLELYNIGGDGVMTIRELYQSVINEAQSSSKIIPLPSGPTIGMLAFLDKLNISPLGVYQYSMLGRSIWADTTKIKSKLRWRPKKTNADSFIENYKWYVNHKKTFSEVGSGKASNNRSLPKMKIFKLLKLLS